MGCGNGYICNLWERVYAEIEMASRSAFIFQKGTTWTDAQQKKIVPYDGDKRYLFGDSVSLYGVRLLLAHKATL